MAYLRERGVTPTLAAQLIGGIDRGEGLQAILGATRLRRDRLERLADALDSEFLRQALAEDVWYDRIRAITGPEWKSVYDIEVEELHSFVANDLIVHNCASPFKQAEFDIGFGKGISREGSLLDVGVDLGLIKKSGAWYTYDGEQLGQGRENAKAFRNENPEIMVEVSERIRTAVGVTAAAAAEAAAVSNAKRNGNGAVHPDDQPISLG
jgi:recombination protein RecA